MGIHASDESYSDADTQEPVKLIKRPEPVLPPAPRIPDSDDERETKPAMPTNMRRLMEQINDADSERSDDDPLPPDAPVDFGDEEEVEESNPEKSLPADDGPVGEDGKEHPAEHLPDLPAEANMHEEPLVEEEQHMDDEEEEPVEEQTPSPKKPSPKKKTKAKKDKDPPPAKTIKKASSDAKSKAKATKTKAPSIVRKKLASPKSKPESKPLSSNTSPTASPAPSPKPTKKKQPAKPPTKLAATKASTKPATKPGSKLGAKADMKSTSKGKIAAKAKPQVQTSEKGVKPKKVISKEDKTDKKQLKEKKAVVKTFSKKSKTAVETTITKTKKSATPKKVKAEVKPKKSKGKTKAASRSSEDGEDQEDEMVVDDDSEGAADSSDAEMDDDGLKTPVSKLPILGNLACSSRDENCTALLDHAVEQLGKYNVVSYGADSDCALSAYVIGKGTKRGWGLLQALACGVPLVSDDWLSLSISEGKWKPLDMYRSDRFGQSPRTVDGAAMVCNKLLEGVRVKVHCEGKDAASVRKMLRICGARVAETRMDVVINDTGKQVHGSTNVVKKWLADSIEAGMPLDYEPYVVDA